MFPTPVAQWVYGRQTSGRDVLCLGFRLGVSILLHVRSECVYWWVTFPSHEEFIHCEQAELNGCWAGGNSMKSRLEGTAPWSSLSAMMTHPAPPRARSGPSWVPRQKNVGRLRNGRRVAPLTRGLCNRLVTSSETFSFGFSRALVFVLIHGIFINVRAYLYFPSQCKWRRFMEEDHRIRGIVVILVI